jgi:hypothetical protein
MKACKRLLAGLTLLLATAGLLLFLAGGVGIWLVKEPVTEKATHVFARIEDALEVADQSLENAKMSLTRAAGRLDTVRKEQRELTQAAARNRGLGTRLAQMVQRSVAPELGNAYQTLHKVAEASVVVNSVLEDLGNFPFLAATGLDMGPVTEMNSRLADVGPAAWELSRLLGAPEPDADTAAQLSSVDRAVKGLQGLLAEYKPQIRQVRQTTETLKSKTLPWITPAWVAVSALCFWIALSQVSLIFHACSWWKHAGRTARPPG